MPKSKLNTDLAKSAKKIKKNKTEDEGEEIPVIAVDEPIAAEVDFPTDVSPTEEDDDATYTMGEIQVAGNDEEEVELKVIPTQEATDNEEDVEWVDEEVSMKDEDPYLDGENFDMDNYGADGDDY